MVVESLRTLKQRLGMLQIAGLPLIQYAIKHTFLVMCLLRIGNVVENGMKKNGRFPMEIKAMFSGIIGNYKISFWSAPIYNDCSRWSLNVVRI